MGFTLLTALAVAFVLTIASMAFVVAFGFICAVLDENNQWPFNRGNNATTPPQEQRDERAIDASERDDQKV